MTLKEKIIFGAVVVVVAIIAFTAWNSFHFSKGVSFGAVPGSIPAENYDPYLRTNGGFYTNYPIQTTSTLTAVTQTLTGLLTAVNATFSSTLKVTGLATFSGGVVGDYANSTSTLATSQTLIASDIANYNTVIMTPNTGALTLTFPASSTLSTFLPNAGDSAQQCWYDATSTTGITITFAAGTGFDFRTASSSATLGGTNLLSVPAGSGMCFEFIRENSTATTFNFLTLLTRYAQ